MALDGIFSTTVELLGKSIDLRAKNHNLIASNIANAETPNFTPTSLSFEKELQGALKTRSGSSGQRGMANTHSRHIPLKSSPGGNLQAVQGKVVETPSVSPGKDGNSVEVENEMGRMIENQIMYNASVQMLTKKFEGLRTAIREGK